MQQVSDYMFELPPDLIAQQPLAGRAESRMLVVHRTTGQLIDAQFVSFPSYFGAGDCLVLNNTRVFPARLYGRRNRPDGAEIEVFLLSPADGETVWNALVRPGKRVKPGDRILFDHGLKATVVSAGERGERVVTFEAEGRDTGPGTTQAIRDAGQVPLPPYIQRQPDSQDRERYQTVFSKVDGSAAAPTAGLHFTPEILDRCERVGMSRAEVTLHIGLGTFAPLTSAPLAQVSLHEEQYSIDVTAARLITSATRRVCVGTTSVRAVESAMLAGGIKPMAGRTSLFIKPGFEFRATDALLTNFHLPGSSLLILICAFAGYELAFQAYRHAIAERYRFFSYGDCMLIL